jgi:hypothetical protein
MGKNRLGNDPETASLPIRVFHAVPEPSMIAGRGFLPCSSLYSRTDLNVTARIHRKMLLGRKAGSEATVGRKPLPRVSVQECPAGFFRAGCPRRRTRED